MSVEERQHLLDHFRHIDAICCQPGDRKNNLLKDENDARLTLILYGIQKLFVNFWSFPEPVLDKVKVCEGVGDVVRSNCAICRRCCCRGLGRRGQFGVLAKALEVRRRG